MSDKNIIVIRATKHISKQKLKEFQRLWNNQINEGIVVIPNDFEFVSLDPKTLQPCELEWQEMKKISWLQKLLRKIWKKNENTKRNS